MENSSSGSGISKPPKIDELRKVITSGEETLREIERDLESIPDPAVLEKKIDKLAGEVEQKKKELKTAFFKGDKKEELIALETKLDQLENPFKWYLVNSVDKKNYRIMFGTTEKEKNARAIAEIFAENKDGKLSELWEVPDEEIEKRANAVMFSSNGFYIRITNLKEADFVIDGPKAKYELVDPEGFIIKTGLAHGEAKQALKDSAQKYQDDRLADFEHQNSEEKLLAEKAKVEEKIRKAEAELRDLTHPKPTPSQAIAIEEPLKPQETTEEITPKPYEPYDLSGANEETLREIEAYRKIIEEYTDENKRNESRRLLDEQPAVFLQRELTSKQKRVKREPELKKEIQRLKNAISDLRGTEERKGVQAGKKQPKTKDSATMKSFTAPSEPSTTETLSADIPVTQEEVPAEGPETGSDTTQTPDITLVPEDEVSIPVGNPPSNQRPVQKPTEAINMPSTNDKLEELLGIWTRASYNKLSSLDKTTRETIKNLVLQRLQELETAERRGGRVSKALVEVIRQSCKRILSNIEKIENTPEGQATDAPEVVEEEHVMTSPAEIIRSIEIGSMISYRGKNYEVIKITEGEKPENNLYTLKGKGEFNPKINGVKLIEMLKNGEAVVLPPEAKENNAAAVTPEKVPQAKEQIFVDPLFREALLTVARTGKTFTASLVDRLKSKGVDYPRAEKLLEEMRKHGIVGPMVTGSGRKLLMTRSEIETFMDTHEFIGVEDAEDPQKVLAYLLEVIETAKRDLEEIDSQLAEVPQESN